MDIIDTFNNQNTNDKIIFKQVINNSDYEISQYVDINLIKKYSKLMHNFNNNNGNKLSKFQLNKYLCASISIALIENNFNYLENMIYFSLSALYQDNYLDNKLIDNMDKKNFYLFLNKLLTTGIINSPKTEIEKIMIKLYKLWIDKLDNKKDIIDSLIKVNTIQYESYKKQQKENSQLKDVDKITGKKSMATAHLCLLIMNKDPQKDKLNFKRIYYYAFIVQLLDDLEDIKYDLNDNINTYFTINIKNNKNIDNIIIKLIYQIHDFIKIYYHDQYHELSQLCLEYINFIIYKNKKYISPNLIEKIENSTYLSYQDMKNKINEFIKNISD